MQAAAENDMAQSKSTSNPCMNYQFKTTQGDMGITQLISTNWQSAATVALVSVSLSIALVCSVYLAAFLWYLGLFRAWLLVRVLTLAWRLQVNPFWKCVVLYYCSVVWGGLTFGVFGSSPYNIIGQFSFVFFLSVFIMLGPAGALSGMLNTYAVNWGPEILPWISVCPSFCIILQSSS